MRKKDKKIFDLFIKKISEGDDIRYRIVRDSFIYAYSLLEEIEFESTAMKNEYYSYVFGDLILQWDCGIFKLRNTRITLNTNPDTYDRCLLDALEREMYYIVSWAKKEAIKLKESGYGYTLSEGHLELIENIVHFWLGDDSYEVEYDDAMHDITAQYYLQLQNS